jgi:hypothetical protein
MQRARGKARACVDVCSFAARVLDDGKQKKAGDE